ncbi:uncharacterized protein TNCV_3547461 [Trichonephila clavipes]|nr:uncharacterized protein TNCV_3547461 [Trichonephila clavipes]
MFQILLWSPWKYRCGQRTVRMAVVACSQKQNTVFARRRIKVKAELKLKKAETLEKKLRIRAEKERERRTREDCHGWLGCSPIFDDFFQHLWPYIGNNTANVVFQIVKLFVAYPHRPMTLHSPTVNSLAVLNHKILEANSQVQNVKLGGHQTCLSINRLWHELCDMLRRLVGTTAPDIMIVQFRMKKFASTNLPHHSWWDPSGSWRRSNLQLYRIYKQPDIVILQRLKWAGHLARMNADRCSKNIFLAKPMENRPRGRLPLRWINCIEKDLKTLKGQKTGKQLPKVEMDGENFWRRPESIQGCRTFEEENLPHPSTTATN